MPSELAFDLKFVVKSPDDSHHLQMLGEMLEGSPNPTRVECVRDSDWLSCELRARACDGIQLLELKIDTPPGSNTHLIATRARSHIARNSKAEYNAVIWLDGEHELTSDRQTRAMHPGDFTFTNNEVEFCSRMHNRGHAYNLALPASWDRIGDTRIEKVFGNIFSEQPKNRSRLIAYVGQLLARPNALAQPDVSEKLYDVLALALNPRAASEHQSGLLAMMHNHIDIHYADSSLSPANVAAAFNISVRYLHQLFLNGEFSFTEYLNFKRLMEAHRLLTDPRYRQQTVLRIAFDCGFRDINHFGRRFKTHFGYTPGELRRSVLDGTQPDIFSVSQYPPSRRSAPCSPNGLLTGIRAR